MLILHYHDTAECSGCQTRMEARSQAGGKADNPQVPTSEFGVRNVRYHHWQDERRASCSNRDIGLLCYPLRPPGRGPSSCLVPAIPLASASESAPGLN
jgi:hypothetical protein